MNTTNEPKPLYTIKNMVPEAIVNMQGPPTDGYRVEFTTSTGHKSHVKVPRSENLEDDVHAAVEQEATRIVNTVNRVVPTTPNY